MMFIQQGWDVCKHNPTLLQNENFLDLLSLCQIRKRVPTSKTWGRGYPEDYRLWHASTSESVDSDWQMIATGEHNSSSRAKKNLK